MLGAARLRSILALAVFSCSPALAQAPPPALFADSRVLDSLDPCRARAADEIMVCGRRDANRYRLPLPGAGRARPGEGAVRGEVPRASADVAILAPCGIFAGQRRRNEEEMAEFGYGRGRDPITLVSNLITRLVDPEAEIGPPPPFPE